MQSILQQIRDNVVAIISLIVAISALGYTTWREEHTEKNRNIRAAAFEVLMHLGELQMVVNTKHYDPQNPSGNPLIGWGHIALIDDLSQILPAPAPKTADELVNVWKENWKQINENEDSADKISDSIDKTREVVLKILKELP